MIPALVLILTSLSIFTFLLQAVLPKGTRRHIIQGFLPGIFAISSIVINTAWVHSTRGLVLDPPFILHMILGLGFVAAWAASCKTGIHLLWQKKEASRKYHRRMFVIQGILLAVTILLGIGMPYLRSLLRS